ncbi:MAG: hypothetical protein ACREAU_01640 [Nitrosopumilaceae archaeon]
MKLADLFEAPQFIMPTSFNLDNKRFNSNYAKTLLRTKNKHIVDSIDETTQLYEFNTGYALIDTSVPEILYYVRFKIARISYIGRPCVQQIKIWRSFVSTKNVDIAQKVFFEHLMPKFGCIITDIQQTEGERSGQAFWFNRIANAFVKHLFVYFVSLIPHRMIKQIHNDKELKEIISNAWGWDHKYQAKRIIIADKPLQQKQDTSKGGV